MDWDSGEYLCPLCECYGSTVLPLIPQVGQLALGTEPTLPVRTITMQEWRGLLTLAVELGSGDDMDTGQCYKHMVVHTYVQCTYVCGL